MYSAIVLGATENDDGLLEAREMMDLHLGADLAILSACDSASGDLAQLTLLRNERFSHWSPFVLISTSQ